MTLPARPRPSSETGRLTVSIDAEILERLERISRERIVHRRLLVERALEELLDRLEDEPELGLAARALVLSNLRRGS